MYLLQIHQGGFVVPFEKELEKEKRNYELVGYGGNVKVFGLTVDGNQKSYNDYVTYMADNEELLINNINNAIGNGRHQ